MWNARDQAICSLHMDTDTDTLSRIGLVFLEIIWFEDPITEYMKVYIYIYIYVHPHLEEKTKEAN